MQNEIIYTKLFSNSFEIEDLLLTTKINTFRIITIINFTSCAKSFYVNYGNYESSWSGQHLSNVYKNPSLENRLYELKAKIIHQLLNLNRSIHGEDVKKSFIAKKIKRSPSPTNYGLYFAKELKMSVKISCNLILRLCGFWKATLVPFHSQRTKRRILQITSSGV